MRARGSSRVRASWQIHSIARRMVEWTSSFFCRRFLREWRQLAALSSSSASALREWHRAASRRRFLHRVSVLLLSRVLGQRLSHLFAAWARAIRRRRRL
eukprot:60200-Hanusia_phi.AAC.1